MNRSHHPVIVLVAWLSLAVLGHGLDASLSSGFSGNETGKCDEMSALCLLPTPFLLRVLRITIRFPFPKICCILKGNGNIVLLNTKALPVTINSFDINMDATQLGRPETVEIYFTPGYAPAFVSPVNFPFTKIFQANVTGMGKGNITVLPDLPSPVSIPANTTYSFYITTTTTTAGGAKLWYHAGVAVGQVIASDQYLRVAEGYAVSYPFLSYIIRKRWNGKGATCSATYLILSLHNVDASILMPLGLSLSCRINCSRNCSLFCFHGSSNTQTNLDTDFEPDYGAADTQTIVSATNNTAAIFQAHPDTKF